MMIRNRNCSQVASLLGRKLVPACSGSAVYPLGRPLQAPTSSWISRGTYRSFSISSIQLDAGKPNYKISEEFLEIEGTRYSRDPIYTNVSDAILSKVSRNLHLMKNHPINILKNRIEQLLPKFKNFDQLKPIVSTKQNFDDLLIPENHPSKALTDTYYINKDTLLRTHTSAHQSTLIKAAETDAFLVTADVYRRDEINVTHYPVFHQMEGVLLFDRKTLLDQPEIKRAIDLVQSGPNKIVAERDYVGENLVQECHSPEEILAIDAHLRYTLENLIRGLFSTSGIANQEENLKIRWVSTYFPFTAPSWEMEIFFNGEWLEVLGCGMIQQDIINRTGRTDKIGWAFGLGLERIAMTLFEIPDIRLFWSQDPRFINQFSEGKVTKFEPFSKYPACYKDISFWLPKAEKDSTTTTIKGSMDASPHDNDFVEIVRDIAGDLVEDVAMIDEFYNKKKGQTSRCYRVMYRSMERTMTNAETNDLHTQVTNELCKQYPGIQIR